MQPGQHRETARVLLHSNRERFFLLLTHFDPEVQLPPRWITPGGGIDAPETILSAAVRELREETGLVIAPDALGEPVWQTSGRWHWGDGLNSHTYTDHFFQLDITSIADPNRPGEWLTPETFNLNNESWTEDEHRDVLEHRWWSIDDLSATSESVGPPGLADWLRSWT